MKTDSSTSRSLLRIFIDTKCCVSCFSILLVDKLLICYGETASVVCGAKSVQGDFSRGHETLIRVDSEFHLHQVLPSQGAPGDRIDQPQLPDSDLDRELRFHHECRQ
jgi:hypothetical protein